MFRLGSGERLNPASGWEQVVFPDPTQPAMVAALPSDLVGGYQYAALHQVGDTNPEAAASSIATANQQAANYYSAVTNNNAADQAYWEGKLRETVRNLEVMRGLFDIFGRTW